MERLGILHITDLHCMEEDPNETVGDIKDNAISSELGSELIYEDTRELFFNYAPQKLVDSPLDVIACTGDLGVGKIKGSVKSGATYIAKLADRLKINHDHVLISPGNHDLDRYADIGKEFDEFSQICTEQGFMFAKDKNPAQISIKGVPIIALNSCLGGTEHALHGLPKDIWDQATESLSKFQLIIDGLLGKIPKHLHYQMQAMDIPAIGKTQVMSTLEYLKSATGNIAVILTHHNPLPTQSVEVRPYASLIDSGPLIFGLMDEGRKVLVLHGHTHCNVSLTTFPPDINHSGFVTAIGGHGLHSTEAAAAAYIQIIIGSDKNILAAIVFRYEKRGQSFITTKSYIYDRPSSDVEEISNLQALKPNQQHVLDEAIRLLRGQNRDSDLNRLSNEMIAELLIRHSSRNQLAVDNLEKEPSKWVVRRNA